MSTPWVSPTCTLCALHTQGIQVVQPQIPQGARVLFLGRDPGEVENRTGIPFDPGAPAGGLLRGLLQEVSIDLEWCAFDNVVHCHTPKNRGPKKEEVVSCAQWVRLVLQRLPPSVEYVVTLGQEALEALVQVPVLYSKTKPLQPIADVRGVLQDWGRFKLLPMYHPSAALRNGAYRRWLMVDLVHLAELLGVPRITPAYRRVDWRDWHLPHPASLIALDCETRKDGTLLGVGMALRLAPRKVVAFYSEDVGHISPILHGGCPLIMHGSYFDIQVLRNAGLWPEVHSVPHDTELMAQVLGKRETIGSLGLKQLALAEFGYSWPGIPELGYPEDMSLEERATYCMRDAVATLELGEKYLEELAND